MTRGNQSVPEQEWTAQAGTTASSSAHTAWVKATAYETLADEQCVEDEAADIAVEVAPAPAVTASAPDVTSESGFPDAEDAGGYS